MRCTFLPFLLGLACGLVAEAKLFALNHTGVLPNATSPGAFRLLTIDDDGTSSAVGNSTIPWTPGSSTVDYDHGILYFIGAKSFIGPNTTLVGVSLKTGAVVSSAAIPFLGPDYELFAADLVYASELGEVLVLVTKQEQNSTTTQVFGRMHPETGKWDTITTVAGPSIVKVDQAGDIRKPLPVENLLLEDVDGGAKDPFSDLSMR